MSVSVSIVSISPEHTTFCIKFLQATILIEHRTLANIGMKIGNQEDGAAIKDETTGTEYRLDISREAVIISRDEKEDVEVCSNDFNTAIDKVVKCTEDTKALALIYGPKILNEVILKAMEHDKKVMINEISAFGNRILGYDGFAFEIETGSYAGPHQPRRFILHSYVHTIGIME